MKEVVVSSTGRAVGLDAHLEFCEVAICDGSQTRSVGRVPSTPDGLRSLADSLQANDRVVLEMSSSASEIVRILEPCVARVVVVSPSDTGIAHARAKTDRLDARTLARLLWAGDLDSIWMPDERIRVLRRRLSRRDQLVRSRTRCKNEVHAVLMRRLVGRCPYSDMFGKAGRRWLRTLELPVEECETVEAAMRQIEFLDAEIAEVERLIAREILWSADIRALMSVPGVNMICAATFIAAIGDIRRFPTPKQLVGYLGLDPKVRQSGSTPARTGRISKQGSPQARWTLVEAAWIVARQPGPMRAFHQRVKARRGHQIATVATARKLACLFWCLLTRDEHYAHARPSLTAKKLRKLELKAGAKRYERSAAGIYKTNEAMRAAELRLAEQAEASYTRMVRDWQAMAPQKGGAGVTPERA
jgi:transposase